MRWLTSIVAALALGLFSGTASADDNAKKPAGTSDSTMATSGKVNQHIAFIDLNLTAAVNSAKALSMLANVSDGEKTLVNEGQKSLTAGIDGAIQHLGDVKKQKASIARLDELDRHLTEARTAAKKLNSAKSTELSTGVDTVGSHLSAAMECFRDIARTNSYTILNDQNLRTVPVSGQKPGDIDRDMGKEPIPTTTPKSDPSNPSLAQPPSTSPPGATPPSPTEPPTPNPTPPPQ